MTRERTDAGLGGSTLKCLKCGYRCPHITSSTVLPNCPDCLMEQGKVVRLVWTNPPATGEGR